MNSANSVNFTGLVTVVGDVMLDSYWKGPSNRISPEAPVPVVRVTDREERAGGAANVAINIASLGAPCNLVGIVGEDKNAEILEKIVRSHSIKTDFVLTKDHPTSSEFCQEISSYYVWILKIPFPIWMRI